MNEQKTENSDLSFRVVASIHRGKRERQEDAIGYWKGQNGASLFAAVADGAGGHGGGAEASACVISQGEECWRDLDEDEKGTEFLGRWVQLAIEAIQRVSREQGSDGRSVVVGLLIRGHQADWVHVGDCRLYHFRDGDLLKRTRDDSVVQILFEQGEISEEEMGRHPDQNRLLQALGSDDLPTLRRGSAMVEPGDVFLLCSDGFWENRSSSEIVEMAFSDRRRWKRRLSTEIKKAVRDGGKNADNTSAILIGVKETDPNQSDKAGLWRWGRVCALILLVVALVFASSCFLRKVGILDSLPSLRSQLIRVDSDPLDGTSLDGRNETIDPDGI